MPSMVPLRRAMGLVNSRAGDGEMRRASQNRRGLPSRLESDISCDLPPLKCNAVLKPQHYLFLVPQLRGERHPPWLSAQRYTSFWYASSHPSGLCSTAMISVLLPRPLRLPTSSPSLETTPKRCTFFIGNPHRGRQTQLTITKRSCRISLYRRSLRRRRARWSY